MRIAIVTRIFAPEPSAASFRLEALAHALYTAGHDVHLITSQLPAGTDDIDAPYHIIRTPVLRDSSGYVRGYLPYLSFDIPTWVRLTFGRSYDAVVVEPPPTTGFITRVATAIRSTPYFYYCADVWADAARQTGSPDIVVAVVRMMETFAWRGARHLLSVSEGVTRRIRELGVLTPTTTIGNGINVGPFQLSKVPSTRDEFVYAGTASEWHGASIFIQALPLVHDRFPHARIRFIGGGSEITAMKDLAASLDLGNHVSFEPVISPAQLAPTLGSAVAALASVKPHAGYDFAFPTKMYGAAAVGTPIIYAGIGPGREFVAQEVNHEPLGVSVDMESTDVAHAMLQALENQRSPEKRHAVALWAREHVSLHRVAQDAARLITAQ